MIIIGIRKDLHIIPTEPKPILTKENRIPVSTILLPKEEVDTKYYLSEKALNGIKAKREKAKQNGNGFGAQFLKMDKPSYTIPARYWKDGYDALVEYSDTQVRRLTILELKRIKQLLSKNGLLYIEVPGLKQLDNWGDGDFSLSLHIGHTQHFTLKTLINLMKKELEDF